MCSLANADTIAVVYFYSDEKSALVGNFLQNLKKMYANLGITSIEIIDKKVQKLSNQALETRQKEVEKNAAFPFDILIHLDTDENPNALLFTNTSQAKFKIGFFKEKWNEIYDFIIKANSIEEFIEILKKYTSNF
jgi:hypothetical protein